MANWFLKKYNAKLRLEGNDLIEECDDYVMDKVEDEQDDTEFYFDEIIDKFSDHDEVLLEDSIDPNLENSSIGTPNPIQILKNLPKVVNLVGWLRTNVILRQL